MIVLYILLAVLLFGVLIFVHELGHFLCAKACGVKILEFALGMGPKILKHRSKKTGTLYSLRLFPVGGFCSMKGEGYDDEDEKKDADNNVKNTVDTVKNTDVSTDTDNADTDRDSYRNKPAWMKILILLSGPLMNIFVGIIMTFILVIGIRYADGSILLPSNTVSGFSEEAFSNRDGGLMVGDTVVRVGGVGVHTGQELNYEIMMQGSKAETVVLNINGEDKECLVVYLDLTVIRNGKTILLEDVMFSGVEQDGIMMSKTDFVVSSEPDSFGNILKQTWFRSTSYVKMVWDSLIGLLTGRFALTSVSGPVGATQVITEAAKDGWYMVLNIFIVIAMNLGVFNLLPFLPLDGGHIVFSLYELIARRPAPRKVEEYCQIGGVIVMFALMIIISVKDVINLF